MICFLKGLFFFFPLALFAETTISSKTADLFNHKLELTHGLSFDHPLGKMSAKKGSFENFRFDKKIPFSSFILKKKVRMDLINGGRFKSESAFFNSKQNKIYFFPKKSSSCDQTIPDMAEKELHPLDPPLQKQVTFEEKGLKIFADKASVLYDNGSHHPKKIIFKQNVQIFSFSTQKKGYGKADKITYFPEKELLFLTAKQNKKVSFWQKNKKILASAFLIKKDQIEALGDVRMILDLDPKNILSNFKNKKT